MISRRLKRQHQQVRQLSGTLDHERRVLRALRRETRRALGAPARSGWVLAGCFAAGIVTARASRPVARLARRLPLVQLARQIVGHLFI